MLPILIFLRYNYVVKLLINDHMEINCKDVSGWDCDFVASDESADEIRQQMIDHMLAVHGDQMNELSDKDQNRISEKIEEFLMGQ